MKTSIEQILTRELVGKEVLVYKYKSDDPELDYYYRLSVSPFKWHVLLDLGYAKIVQGNLKARTGGQIYIALDIIPTEIIDIRRIVVNIESLIELKED